MELSEEQKREIAELRHRTDCPKGFACCESDSANLCKAKYVVSTSMVAVP